MLKNSTPPEATTALPEQYEIMLLRGRALMRLAYLIRTDILTGQWEQGVLSKTQYEAYRALNYEVYIRLDLQTLDTADQVRDFFLHARQELIEARKECKAFFPELFKA